MWHTVTNCVLIIFQIQLSIGNTTEQSQADTVLQIRVTLSEEPARIELVKQEMSNYVFMLSPDLLPSAFYTADKI